VLVADSRGGEDARSIEQSAEGTVLVLGDERLGPSQVWEGERRVCIAQQRFDSLNVAMAGTILLYELGKTPAGNRNAGPIGLSAGKEES
jgi:tRNA G18 (ribose-2'-O)-methylase SpoU